jgi:hypothetical protein
VRAMREREEEIKRVNQSMHQVKDIYSVRLKTYETIHDDN